MRPSCNLLRHRLTAFAGVLVFGAALGGCIGYDGDFDRGYQVDPQALDQVKVGATTKPEALALMGTPSTTSTEGFDICRRPRKVVTFPETATSIPSLRDCARHGWLKNDRLK